MQKIRIFLATILVGLFISACGKGDIQRSRNLEEPAVYSALINDQLEAEFSYLMGDPIIIVNSSEYETVEDKILFGG